jgi:hypothetical protein
VQQRKRARERERREREREKERKKEAAKPLYPRTSKYPDCRLLPLFPKPLCNQKFAFQHKIASKQNHVKPTHTKC